MLESFLNLHQLENIIVAGDLNVTLATNEKKGGSLVRDPLREWVKDIMLGWDLIDIKPVKGKFTWTNKRLDPGHVAARLDRFLVHSSFLSLGLLASSKILPHCTSDHKPILLELALDHDLGPIPFRFSPLWIQQEDFMQVVSDSWETQVKGSPSFIWEAKIKKLKHELKGWARSIPSPISRRKSAQAELEAHQTHMDFNPISDCLLRKEENLQKAFHSAYRMEEEFWRKKSRNLWLLSGDKNTKYFHKQAVARKNYKAVSEIIYQVS